MSKPKILIVDDESNARSYILEALCAEFDCDCTEAGDGEKAIECLKEEVYDIIILDIKMPKKNGMHVIKEVAARAVDTDILVLSSWISDDVVEEALSLGAADYISKPVSLKALKLKVSDMLDKRDQ